MTPQAPPENVSAEQTDDQTVHVNCSAIFSFRQPHVNSDITHHELKCCSIGSTVQEPICINAQKCVTSVSLLWNDTHRVLPINYTSCSEDN